MSPAKTGLGDVDTGRNAKGRMVANNDDELAAAAVMYGDVMRPQNGRDIAMAQDDTDGLMRDELAEKLRACGCPAKDAARYVGVLIAAFRAKDVECAAEAEPDESLGDVMVRVESTVREMLRSIANSRRAKLEARVHLMARGDAESAKSMRALAREYGLSVEAISKKAEECRREFCLPENQFNKSEQARRVYQETNGGVQKHES